MSNIPLNIDWQQILLHLFNFSILVGGLYLLLFKPVKSFMDKREKHYADMEAAAAEREKHTADVEAAIARREAALDTELDEKRAAAAREAEALSDRRCQEAEAKAQKIVDDARAAAQQERKQILTDANREIIALAEEAMTKLAAQTSPYEEFLLSAEEDKQDENA